MPAAASAAPIARPCTHQSWFPSTANTPSGAESAASDWATGSGATRRPPSTRGEA